MMSPQRIIGHLRAAHHQLSFTNEKHPSCHQQFLQHRYHLLLPKLLHQPHLLLDAGSFGWVACTLHLACSWACCEWGSRCHAAAPLVTAASGKIAEHLAPHLSAGGQQKTSIPARVTLQDMRLPACTCSAAAATAIMTAIHTPPPPQHSCHSVHMHGILPGVMHTINCFCRKSLWQIQRRQAATGPTNQQK